MTELIIIQVVITAIKSMQGPAATSSSLAQPKLVAKAWSPLPPSSPQPWLPPSGWPQATGAAQCTPWLQRACEGGEEGSTRTVCRALPPPVPFALCIKGCKAAAPHPIPSTCVAIGNQALQASLRRSMAQPPHPCSHVARSCSAVLRPTDTPDVALPCGRGRWRGG